MKRGDESPQSGFFRNLVVLSHDTAPKGDKSNVPQKQLDKNHGLRYPKNKKRSRDDHIRVMSLVDN